MHNLRVGTRAIDIADITINQRERLGMGEPRDGERPERAKSISRTCSNGEEACK